MKGISYNQSREFNKTRQTLLERVKHQHDEHSWEEFISIYRPYVYSICRRMNLSHHDSEDVVQQVLLKLWDKLPEFNYDDRRSFRAWIGSVTRNTTHDFFRKQNRRVQTLEKASREDLPGQNVTPSELERIVTEEWKKYLMAMAMERVRKQFPLKAINVFLDLCSGGSRQVVAERYHLTTISVSVYKGRVQSALHAEICALEEEL
jgi:RNA polymerase sigma factor (sigma-70 family)